LISTLASAETFAKVAANFRGMKPSGHAISPPIADGDVQSSPLFQTTKWGIVLAAADEPSAAIDGALNELCRTYWYPLYAYVRRQGRSAHDAQDLTQEFFARLLEKKGFRTAAPERGRFRSFLLTSLKHFLINEWRGATALKRGGGQVMEAIDTLGIEKRYEAEAEDGSSPDRAFERQWAATLLETVLSRLRAEYVALSKLDLFEGLKPILWGDPAAESYAGLAGKLDMTAGALRVAAHRMRERYGVLTRAAVAETVAKPADVEDELRSLISILRN
jgi:RNA polymerase sigma factor (sigma-70 family)